MNPPVCCTIFVGAAKNFDFTGTPEIPKKNPGDRSPSTQPVSLRISHASLCRTRLSKPCWVTARNAGCRSRILRSRIHREFHAGTSLKGQRGYFNMIQRAKNGRFMAWFYPPTPNVIPLYSTHRTRPGIQPVRGWWHKLQQVCRHTYHWSPLLQIFFLRQKKTTYTVTGGDFMRLMTMPGIIFANKAQPEIFQQPSFC